MLPHSLVRYRKPLILLLHLSLIPIGYFAAFQLRLPRPMPEQYVELFLITLPVIAVARLAAFGAFGLLTGWWRHVGMQDLVNLVKAITVSSLLLLAALYMLHPAAGVPRMIVLLDWGIAILLFGGARFAVRCLREGRFQLRASDAGTRTLVIGAGEAAERLLRQLPRESSVRIDPVGLVDDDPAKRGLRIHGVRVLGTTDELKSLVERTGARQLVIAVPSASGEQIRALVEQCMVTGVEFKIVPSMREMIDGRVRLSELRDVKIEDLLGREAIQLDLTVVEADLEGRTVLVTGAAGSIGSELARQIAGFGPARLVLLEQAESPLYFVELALRKAHPGLEIVPVIADVTDVQRVARVFRTYRPDYVFHAAAYKHVPLMEANPVEAVRNNVYGTFNVAQAAAEHGARKFVLISTDKAVRPSSVMGATKRIAERLVLGWPALRRSETDFRAVRFGNVLGSNGSVIPVFEQQLAAGEPLTVTHPEVTRYFMTIPEAVQLVLQAAALPEAERRICMLEMGEPVRIAELAENLIRLKGLEPYRDVPIVFTGLRPGEKLYEELMTDAEETVPTTIEKIRVVQTDETDPDAVAAGLDRLAAAAELGERADLVLAIAALVPECVAPLRDAASKAATLGRRAKRGLRA